MLAVVVVQLRLLEANVTVTGVVVNVTDADAVQPAELVTVTVYVPAQRLERLAVDAPVFHL